MKLNGKQPVGHKDGHQLSRELDLTLRKMVLKGSELLIYIFDAREVDLKDRHSARENRIFLEFILEILFCNVKINEVEAHGASANRPFDFFMEVASRINPKLLPVYTLSVSLCAEILANNLSGRPLNYELVARLSELIADLGEEE